MAKERDTSKTGDPTPLDPFDGDLHATVRKSLGRLFPMMEPELAEVFRRSELLGHSCETIAASLGVTVDTAEFRLREARAEMRKLLKHSAKSYLIRSRQPPS